MVLKERHCPYCNEKISRKVLFYLKNNMYFKCDKCKKVSLLKLSQKINKAVIVLVALSLSIVVTFSLLNMWFIGAILLTCLFAGFYVFVPDFLTLKKQDNDN